MPLIRSKASSKSEKSRLVFKKPCKYIGSVAVTLLNGEERQRFVNEKLVEMKDVGKGVPVVIVITDEGVKVLKENESAVKMAHGIIRIVFSTCQPEQRLFAYVATSQSVENTSIIQAHMFKTKKNSHSQQLSLNLSKAFKIAYARDSTRQKNRVKLFETEAAENKPGSEIQSRGKRWAKVELAHGHELSSHALHAKGIFSSSDVKKVMQEADLQSNQKVAAKENSLIEENNNISLPMQSSNEMDDSSSKSAFPKKSQNDGQSSTQGRKVSSEREKHWSTGYDIINLDINPCPIDKKSTKGQLDILVPKSKFSDVNKASTSSLWRYENIEIDETTPDVFLDEEKECFKSDGTIDQGNDIPDSKKGRESPHILRSRMDISRFTMSEDDILKCSEWYQAGFSREIAEMALEDRSVGSFFIRESATRPGTFVMSVKVPSHLKTNGVGHFLIESLPDGFIKLQGFPRTFPTLLDLVAHYGSVQEDIPCQLRLANDNPLFLRRLHIDQPDFLNLDEDGSSDEDPDYENFSSNIEIMKELSMLQEAK